MTRPATAASRQTPPRTKPTAAAAPPPTPEPKPEALEAAREAGLVYVSDLMPGLRRIRHGRGFQYLTAAGARLRDRAEIDRIRALAIPPAWTDVWICPHPRGHIQAIGRDARRRKQYRYHPRWREVRDETKYGQLVDFARLLPRIRRRLERDLARSGLPREKVLATVVRLLEATLVRIGNEEYARANQSYGLTTMRDRHVEISGHTLEFQFKGKSGRTHALRITDRRLARIVKACQDIPGYELFQYLDDEGRRQSVDSGDVNAYLREIAGEDVTAKLFRTWAGTVEALAALRSLTSETPVEAKRELRRVVEEVADQLGNTPAICRKCYIHPAVVECYQRGLLPSTLATLGRASPRKGNVRTPRRSSLGADERLTLAFLRRWQRRRKSRESLLRP